MGKKIQWWLSVILGSLALLSLWNLASFFRPISGNHILIVNKSENSEFAIDLVVKLKSDSNAVVFEKKVRVGAMSGAVRILDCNQAFFNGTIEVSDLANSVTRKTDFLPNGRYEQTAVVSLYDLRSEQFPTSKEVMCSFSFLTEPRLQNFK